MCLVFGPLIFHLSPRFCKPEVQLTPAFLYFDPWNEVPAFMEIYFTALKIFSGYGNMLPKNQTGYFFENHFSTTDNLILIYSITVIHDS